MGLKCKSCGSTNTKCVEKKDLVEASKGVGASSIGSKGFVDPNKVIDLFRLIFEWLNKREDGKQPYVVCKDCGYYEQA